MGSKLLSVEFTVADEIRVDRKWMQGVKELEGFGDGRMLMLLPACSGEEDTENLLAIATTREGKEAALEFDALIVNEKGRVSLFIEGILSKTVPNGSKVRFERNPEAEEDAQYISQGRLDVPEADRILPRMEREGIRFQIDTDVGTHPSGKCSFRDGRIELFVHVQDIPAWEKVRADYFPG